MHLPSTSLSLLLIAATLALARPEDPASIHTATVYAGPLAASPTRLAEIEYSTADDYASILNYNPPSADPSDTHALVGISVYNASSRSWLSRTVTSATSFDARFQGTISLHVDTEGNVWRASFHSSTKSGSAGGGQSDTGDGKPRVKVFGPAQAPQPHLNKPVVLNTDGKAPEPEVEKSFFQK